MEGYSVTEAASILGVPTERVWELLARGVLSGAAEGETGMRVYLQPRPAPAPPAPDSGRPNGDGAAREPERELSPFRELLTEFRNLTERYGQALLALGEARGEVAALRSRVDLLEARMDLRLPMSTPTAWPAPMPQPAPRTVAGPEAHDLSADDDVDTVQDVDAAHEADEDRPSRRRRQRRATENFAEALARAEDPTRPELPGAAETAAALAALRADGAADTRGPEGSLPRELPAADSIPMAEEAQSERPAQPVEERAELPATEASAPTASAAPEPAAASGDTDDVPAGATVAAEDDAQPPLVSEVAEDAEVAEAEPAAEPVAAAAPEPDPEQAPPLEEVPPITWDPERYSVDIGEPDWYVEDQPPTSMGADRAADDTGDPASEPSAVATDEPASPSEGEDADGAEHQPSPEAAATVADTGAEEMEVVGSQPPPEHQPDVSAAPAPRALPGSRELDEALAALDALAGRTRSVDPAARTWPAADPVPNRPVGEARSLPSGAVGEAPRLAATPASRAYRRLRRIFPG
jgi:hypothetical protein